MDDKVLGFCIFVGTYNMGALRTACLENLFSPL